jgi:hypothetical protein
VPLQPADCFLVIEHRPGIDNIPGGIVDAFVFALAEPSGPWGYCVTNLHGRLGLLGEAVRAITTH